MATGNGFPINSSIQCTRTCSKRPEGISSCTASTSHSDVCRTVDTHVLVVAPVVVIEWWLFTFPHEAPWYMLCISHAANFLPMYVRISSFSIETQQKQLSRQGCARRTRMYEFFLDLSACLSFSLCFTFGADDRSFFLFLLFSPSSSSFPLRFLYI